jgi:hypothetical protein
LLAVRGWEAELKIKFGAFWASKPKRATPHGQFDDSKHCPEHHQRTHLALTLPRPIPIPKTTQSCYRRSHDTASVAIATLGDAL